MTMRSLGHEVSVADAFTEFERVAVPRRRLRARPITMAGIALLIAGCNSTSANPTPTEPSSTVYVGATAGGTEPSPKASPSAALGDFPDFPEALLPEPMAASLQAVLDDQVDLGRFRGVSAAVIVGGAGHWAGAAGTDLEQVDLTADSPIIIASIGKTVTAAQILRLVEEGEIRLGDTAADHFPPEIDGYDANGATIRDMLGMRSGIADPANYGAVVDDGASISKLVEMLSEPIFAPGTNFEYANMNYVLLGSIIEHVTGQSLWDVFRSDVLDYPGLDGVQYPVRSALAADGWMIESDPASLARWGYELYGRSVLSAASLHTMTDFGDHFYGLGAIDFSDANPATDDSGFGEPAIGHVGVDYGVVTFLVAFPRTGEVVSLQTQGDSPGAFTPMIKDLLAVARDR